jgi:hypothetical protein
MSFVFSSLLNNGKLAVEYKINHVHVGVTVKKILHTLMKSTFKMAHFTAHLYGILSHSLVGVVLNVETRMYL